MSLLWDLGDTDTPPIDLQPEKALPRAVCLCISQGCQQHWDSPASSCTSLSPRSSGPRVSSPAWRAQRGWSGEDSVVLSVPHHPCLPGRAQQVPPPLGSAGMSWRSLETAEGVIRPHPAPKPWGCTRLVWDTLWVQCPSVLFGCSSHSPPCSREQSPELMPDIRKGILSFNRDRKVSAWRTDMRQLLPLSVWKAGWESGLKTQPGGKWDCSKTHSASTPALLGQEKAPESCVGPKGFPKAAGS